MARRSQASVGSPDSPLGPGASIPHQLAGSWAARRSAAPHRPERFGASRGLPARTSSAPDPAGDDALCLGARWRLAGNAADLDFWPEGAHSFTNMGTPLATVALNRITSWISALLDRTEQGS